MTLKLKPLADRLVVEPTERDEVTASDGQGKAPGGQGGGRWSGPQG
jgi:hypothetical protein